MSYEDCYLRNGKKIVVLGKNEPAASGKVNVIVTTVEDSNFPPKCARDPAKTSQEPRGGGSESALVGARTVVPGTR